jgi:hypothetical protein
MSGTYVMSTAFIKLSLLFQFRRVFGPGTRMRQLCVVVIVFTALWGIVFSFLSWFPCFPPSDFWNYYQTRGDHCYAFGSLDHDIWGATYTGHSGTNVFLDIIVLSIPLPLFFYKDTDRRTRWGLVALLMMGIV